jgi:hypothetical protein
MAWPTRQTATASGPLTPIALNLFQSSTFNVGLLASVAAGSTLTFNVEYTFDDIWSTTYNPTAGSALWYSVSGMGAKSADTTGSLAFPVTAVRLNVTAFTSGSVTLVVIQQN